MANPTMEKQFGEYPAVTDEKLDTYAASPISSDADVMTINGTAAKTG